MKLGGEQQSITGNAGDYAKPRTEFVFQAASPQCIEGEVSYGRKGFALGENAGFGLHV